MAFLSKIRLSLSKAIRAVSGKASSVLRSLRKSPSPLSDRLLADALRLAEIPSPTEKEEQRAAFVLERLKALGLNPLVDGEGCVRARITCPDPDDNRPILLLADLSSPRWHPLESLSRLDSERAHGAGLADALAAASLLSIAETLQSGGLPIPKDILLFFSVKPLDNAGEETVRRLCEEFQDPPLAALAVRGTPLGTLSARPLGTYRIEVAVRTDTKGPEAEEDPRSAVDAVVALARALTGVTWDAEGKTVCRIRRVEAGTGFGKAPTEGILDIELESADEAVLELAMKAAVATAEAKGREAKAQTKVTIAGHVPVGDPRVSERLVRTVGQIMKDQHIKVLEENRADPASFFSALGVPAVSVAVASGREGMTRDDIEIASIEKGRRLLAAVVERIAAGGV